MRVGGIFFPTQIMNQNWFSYDKRSGEEVVLLVNQASPWARKDPGFLLHFLSVILSMVFLGGFLYYPRMTATAPSITCRNRNVSSRKYLLLPKHLFLRIKKTFLQKAPPQTSLCMALARMMSHDLDWASLWQGAYILFDWLRPTIFPPLRLILKLVLPWRAETCVK